MTERERLLVMELVRREVCPPEWTCAGGLRGPHTSCGDCVICWNVYLDREHPPEVCGTCSRGEPCEVDCDEGVVPGVHCPFLHVDNLPDCYCSAWRGK